MHLASSGLYLTGPPSRDRTGIAGHDRFIRQAFSQFPRDHLRLHGLVRARASGLHALPPVLHAFLGILQESAILILLEPRDQLLEHALAVSNQADFDGITQSDTHRVGVDLHASRAARFWQEFEVG